MVCIYVCVPSSCNQTNKRAPRCACCAFCDVTLVIICVFLCLCVLTILLIIHCMQTSSTRLKNGRRFVRAYYVQIELIDCLLCALLPRCSNVVCTTFHFCSVRSCCDPAPPTFLFSFYRYVRQIYHLLLRSFIKKQETHHNTCVRTYMHAACIGKKTLMHYILREVRRL